MLPIGHTSYLKSIKISPEGKKAITVGEDKKTILWDIETGYRLADLTNENIGLDDVLFNANGTRILGMLKYADGTSIPLWNGKTGELITRLTHTKSIRYAEFSPDKQKILTTSYDGLVKIWDPNNGTLLDSLTVNTLVFKAIFSQDGKQIVTADARSIIIWDLLKKVPLFTLDGHTDIVADITFSPDQSKILSSSYDHTSKMWDAKTGKLLYTLNLNDKLEEAYFNVTGNVFVTRVNGFDHKNIKLWDANTGNLIETLSNDKDEPRFATFSHDGKIIASGSSTDEVKIWEVQTGKLLQTLKGHYGGARVAQFTQDDSKLIVGTGSTNTKFWDLKTGKLLFDFKGDGNGVLTIAMSPDGKRLITPMGNLAQVWDLEKNTLITQLKGATTNAIEKIEFLDDQKTLITDNATQTFTRIWDIENGDMLGGQMYAQNDIERIIYGKSYLKALVRYKDSKTNEIWDLRKGTLISTLDKKYSGYQNRWAFTPDETKLVTAAASENLINIWDSNTGELVRQIDRKNKVTINHLLITPDNKLLLCIDNESNAMIWELATGNEIATINNMSGKFFHNFAFIGHKNWFLTSDKGNAKIWDISTGALVMNLAGVKESIRYWKISADNKRFLTAEFYQENAKLWNLETKRLIAELPGAKREVGKIAVSSDWKYIIISSSFGPKINVFNGIDGTLIHSIDAHKTSTSNLMLADETTTFFSYGSDEIKRWDLVTGKLLMNYSWQKKYASSFAYDYKTKQLLAGSSGGEIRLWNAETGEVINNFTGHTSYVYVVKFGPKENTIISSAEDQTVKIWNSLTGKNISTFFPVGEADFLNKVNYGYYKSSPGASKLLHYVSKDLQPINFDQLDVKYNRPDKVLQEMGSADTSLITAFHKAYLKRIKKLGIDTGAFRANFALPTLTIVNRDKLAFEQKENLISIHVKASDSANKIDRFNVWVNETPLYGLKGISLKSKKIQVLDTTITIKLSDGNNQIDASITNENGTESYRVPILVRYAPEKISSEKLYFIGIGINDFAQKENNLKWSVKDVRDLAKAMKLKYGENILIDTLFDQQVTIANVSALKEKLKQSNINDRVIITYSGHGLLNKDFDYFLSTYDVDFNKPEKNGLAYDVLEDLLDNIPARKKLLLIDACHSGELDKDELLKINNAEQSLAKNNTQGGKGVKVINTGNKKANMKSSLELMQQLFVNVGRSTGATVISAAAGTQFALEKNDLKNGVFSYSILEYMQANPHATVNDLKKYVNKRVAELTAGLQIPTTRNETKNLNWQVW
ncbi:caspase family protein [Pedobacter frigiditerrae]|uniref:beta-propeller domain-containing protein n=1 Tax=Pedobacter frigiditerrae TaxID=2530452 RepID=UPI002930D04C|nr:caspase family protein [Pedobacter frigiditerrae]